MRSRKADEHERARESGGRQQRRTGKMCRVPMLSSMFILYAHCGKRINLASKYIGNEKNGKQHGA